MASRGRLLNVLRAAIMCLCWRRIGKEVVPIQSTREKRIMVPSLVLTAECMSCCNMKVNRSKQTNEHTMALDQPP